MLGHLLPRHLEIIHEINRRFIQKVRISHPGDEDLVQRVSLVDDGPDPQIRMPYLSIIGSHAVNGVAALHTKLLKDTVFRDFYKLFPERFFNKTNGITPRLWLMQANPELAELISSRIGHDWEKNLEELRGLEPFQEDKTFRKEWRELKQLKKQQLIRWLEKKNGYFLNPDSMFDVQIKRIHEYKRQHLNALQVITQYLRIKNGQTDGMAPRTVIFGGKAAPGYYLAKLIIRFLNGIADTINADPDMDGLLRVVFLPDYNVKLGEQVYPASDLSEQISTAGKEASGTGNMKFAMNGALTIGTLDGANVEIRELVGSENFFLFGKTVEEITALKQSGYRPSDVVAALPELQEALRLIEMGHFSNGDGELFRPLLDNLTGNDPFYVMADYADYLRAQEAVSHAWSDRMHWNRMSLLNTARTGFFSSDRSISEYCNNIWAVDPLNVEITCDVR